MEWAVMAGKSFLSVFAIMRLTGMGTMQPLSVLLFAVFWYLYQRLAASELRSRMTGTLYAGVLGALFTALTLAAESETLCGDMTSTLFRAGILVLSAAGLFLLYYYGVLCVLYGASLVRLNSMLYPVTWLPYATFGGCLLAWLPYYLYEYPGVMTPDSINQYAQTIGAYALTNHHPVIHTLFIGACCQLGIDLTGDVYVGLGLYTLLQMIFMAFCAAYVVRTLQKASIITPVCVVTACFYALMPYNGIFAVTMWKDIPFAGCMTLMAAGLVRMLLRDKNERYSAAEYVTLLLPYIFAGCMVCLLRTNGWYAFVVTLPILAWCLRDRLRRIVPVHLVILLIVLFVKYPCMTLYEIEQADAAESLSIPVQQLARVVANGESLSAEQEESLAHFMDISQISDCYSPEVSDGIKNLIRSSSGDYLDSHMGEFFSLWASVGVSHLGTYLDAYVAQTHGFWYPDGDYEVGLADGIFTNEFGLSWQPILHGNVFVKIREILFKLWNVIPLFGLCWSMGAMFWGMLISGACCLYLGKGRNVLPMCAAIMLVGTLCIATPVATEFRYAYAVFYGMPVFACLPFMDLD